MLHSSFFFSKKSTCFLALLCWLALPACAQQPKAYQAALALQSEANAAAKENAFGHSLALYRQGAALLEKKPDSLCQSLLWQFYESIGFTFAKVVEYDSSEWYLKKGLTVLQKLYGAESRQAAAYMDNFGGYYAGRGCIFSSLKIRKEALAIIEKIPGEEKRSTTHLINLAAVYYNIGDIELSRLYMGKAVANAEQFGAKDNVKTTCYINYTEILSKEGRFQEAFQYMKKAEAIPNSSPRILYALLGIKANLYRATGSLDTARMYKEQMLAFLRTHPVGPNDLCLALIELASGYMDLNDFESPVPYLNEAIDTALQYMQPNILTEAYLLKGQCFKKQSYPDSAALYFKKSLIANEYDQCSIGSLNRYDQGYRAFFEMGKLYTGQSAMKQFILADSCLLVQRELLVSAESKVSLGEAAVQLAEPAIQLAQTMYDTSHNPAYLEQAFMFTEHAKASVLFEATQKARVMQFAGITEAQQMQEDKILSDILDNEKELQKKLSSGALKSDTFVLQLQGKLFDLYRKKEQLYGASSGFAAREKISFLKTGISLREVLEPDQLMLEYFVGDSAIFIFVVKPGETPQLLRIKKDFPLEEWVKKFREAMMNTALTAQYIEYARKLNDALLGKVMPLLPETGRILLIPDGVLGYLPFAALLSGNPGDPRNFKTYPFLLKRFQFSYCYSAALLKEMKQKQHLQEPPRRFGAFAPVYDGVANPAAVRHAEDPDQPGEVTPLPNSRQEASQAGKHMGGGDLYIGADANRDTFKQVAKWYRVLHLILHGRADWRFGDYSFLVFAPDATAGDDGRCFARELYNLQLNADLVVLSACETALGTLSRGEGIVSLARAFAYAGSKSIVTTLWSIKDAQTAALMDVFYRELAAGKPKDVALQAAQLTYLKEGHESNVERHPYYWAAFQAIGDMAPLKK